MSPDEHSTSHIVQVFVISRNICLSTVRQDRITTIQTDDRDYLF